MINQAYERGIRFLGQQNVGHKGIAQEGAYLDFEPFYPYYKSLYVTEQAVPLFLLPLRMESSFLINPFICVCTEIISLSLDEVSSTFR